MIYITASTYRRSTQTAFHYAINIKETRINKTPCVVCGATRELGYHHVFPKRYLVFANITYLDIAEMGENLVTLCDSCHCQYEKTSKHIDREAENYLFDRALSFTNNYDSRRRSQITLKSFLLFHACKLLLTAWKSEPTTNTINKFSDTDIHLAIQTIRRYTGDGKKDITPENIHSIYSKLFLTTKEFFRMVFFVKKENNEINEFIRRYREHFFNTMNPRFLPDSWVDNFSFYW